MNAKWRSIAVLSIAEVLALGLWFSMTAVIPALRREAGLDDFEAAMLSSAVSLGFVAGTLISAILGLADRLEPRRFFMASALLAAAANLATLALAPDWSAVAVLRFLTGACVAGIYPVGMKIVAGWARVERGYSDMGLLAGILVGAITFGTGAPHLFNVFGGTDWRFTIVLASALAVVAAMLVNFVQLGPRHARSPRFEPSYILTGWRNKALRLANFGYFGHMWELYAMWGWLGVFLYASFSVSMGGDTEAAARYAGLATFAAIGAGGFVGCLLGGALADRVGRTTVTMAALAISGACSATVGFLFGGAEWALVALCLVWGASVVADSAQFSSSVMELSDPAHTGTMVTVQICLGFLLTLAALHLLPALVDLVGWRYAFVFLVPGPVFGFIAMARLRAHPDSVKLAGGRR